MGHGVVGHVGHWSVSSLMGQIGHKVSSDQDDEFRDKNLRFV